MSPAPAACPHDIRPGTTVCLHCRREAHLEASARFRALMVRCGIATLVVCVVAVAGVAGAGALRSSRAMPTTDPARSMNGSMNASMTGGGAAVSAGSPDSLLAAAGVRTDSGLVAVEPGTPAEPPAAVAAVLAPTVPAGRTDLGGGLYAERFGDTVVVHFDTPGSRTRRADKFAGVVRGTLPRVFGGVAASLLSAAPSSTFARPIAELVDAEHPVKLGTLAFWGETREGQDGPLVVSYRAVIAK